MGLGVQANRVMLYVI